MVNVLGASLFLAGLEWRGAARRGLAGCVRSRQITAGKARRVRDWSGRARRGVARTGNHGRHGSDRRGEAWSGQSRQGSAITAGMAMPGTARRGEERLGNHGRQGWAGRGAERSGWDITAGEARMFMDGPGA